MTAPQRHHAGGPAGTDGNPSLSWVHDQAVSSVSTLDPSQRAFVASARTATLGTIAPDGRPRLVPICFVAGPDGPDGRPRLYSALDDKPKASADPRSLGRVRDLLARPDATLLIDRWSEDWDRLGWLRLEVRGERLEPGGSDGDEHAAALTVLRAKYPQYSTHRLEERPVLRFTVERATSWGDLDAAPGDRFHDHFANEQA